jgi:hypothetical protein
MAEFKTAEQYVVEKLETTERELEETKTAHALEMDRHVHEFEELREELHSAYELLDMLREFVHVRTDSYWGNIISFEQIYGKEHPEIVARIMEYYDIRPKEDEDDE